MSKKDDKQDDRPEPKSKKADNETELSADDLRKLHQKIESEAGGA